jgi:hypothetical protein
MAATDGRRGTCTYASLDIAVSALAEVKKKWSPVETVTADGKC